MACTSTSPIALTIGSLTIAFVAADSIKYITNGFKLQDFLRLRQNDTKNAQRLTRRTAKTANKGKKREDL